MTHLSHGSGLERLRPGGRRGSRRERLAIHQPARRRLDRLAAPRPLRQPARLEGRQLQEGQRSRRRSARELPRRADLRARAPDRQRDRRTGADRRSDRRPVGQPRGDPVRERVERGRAHLERLPLAAGGGRVSASSCSVLTGFEPAVEPELFYWGRRITLDAATVWEELAATLDDARARRDTARRAGRLPARSGLRLGRDRGELRPELRRLRRRCRGRGVPRGLRSRVSRALRRGEDPDDATARRSRSSFCARSRLLIR